MIIPLTSLIYRLRSRRTAIFCDQNRSIVINGCESALQEKHWQVLRLLQSRAPEMLSRREVIEKVWNGNWLTGEKGLSQAIWNLRKALDDDAHAPSYIRTMPRLGYKWIYPTGQALQQKKRKGGRAIAALLSITGLTTGITLMAINGPETGLEQPQATADIPPAVSTYLSESDKWIVITLETGCQAFILPSGGKVFGEPVLSENGYHVAFTVRKEASCSTVTLSIADKSFEEFDFCPALAGQISPSLET